ncbi:penicillin acylase family protein [Erythrobacter sp. HA6-11]
MFRKWLGRIAFGVVAIGLVAFVGLANWEPFFAEKGEAPPKDSYSAEIIRDNFGVPHIYGERDADVAFGVAVAHAEDDFFTLQDVVAMSKGRYGAIAGPDGAQVDFLYHLLDAGAVAKHEYPKLPASTRAVFEAYAAGLNHYAETHPDEVKIANLFPVNGVDMAAGFILRQPLFFGLGNTVGDLVAGEELRREFGPDIPGFPRTTATPAQAAADIHGAPAALGEAALHFGSNAFAVRPDRTGGPTTLISNSHQPLRGVVAWYELNVQSEEGWHLSGPNLPGTPFPVMGHNENLGWTYTVNRPDLIDIYQLEVETRDGALKYRLDDEWLDLEENSFTLGVRFGPVTIPVRQTTYRSVHGPVIKNDKGYFAVRYGGMNSAAAMDAFYRLGKANTMEEWVGVYERLDIPNFNVVYADREGNIGYIYNVAFPDRPELDEIKANWRGILDGTKSELIWEGKVGFDEIPKLFNPASGWLYNANNEPFTAAGEGSDLDPADFSPVLGVERKQTNRSRRAYKLLSEANLLDRANLERIKYDMTYERESYVDDLFDELEALDPGEDAELAEARDLLLTWDFTADNKGAADALALLMIRDYMSVEYGNLNRKLDLAEYLREKHAHLMEHFGRLDPPMSELLRLRQGDVDLPLDGGSDTLRASTTWRVDDDGRLSLVHGDSFIQWVEWPADGGRVTSRSIQPFGAATTRPDSPHYTDQMQMFVDHQLKPVHFWREDVMKNAQRRYVVESN